MQENTPGTPHEPQSGSAANTKEDEKPSLGTRIGQIAVGCAVGCAVAPIAAVCVISDTLDAAWDGAEAIADKVTDKVTDGVAIVKDKASEKVEAILDSIADSAKVKAILDSEKVKAILDTIDNKLDHNASMDDKVVGAFKIAKGVVFGCSAMLTGLGMGLVGGFLKSQHMMGQAGKIAQIEFEHAGKEIKEGMERWKRNA